MYGCDKLISINLSGLTKLENIESSFIRDCKKVKKYKMFKKIKD